MRIRRIGRTKLRARPLSLLGLVAVLWSTTALRLDGAERPRVEFRRMVAHWAEYAHPDYLEFISAARPEVVQFGFYGAHFWGLAHTKHGQGYPAHFPEIGHEKNRVWFARMNRELHARKAKVIGHMNVKFLVGDLDGKNGPTGFFKFYRDQWDEKLLGPKPTKDPRDFLELDATGQPISQTGYGIGGMKEYWACLLNPQWRQVLKAWTKYGIEQGADGFVANYFYRHDCHCQHCVRGFKRHLRERHTPDELKAKFGIANLDQHKFSEIVSWHDPQKTTPLRLEMLSFSQIANKQAFDEIFVKYGRSLKPDLMCAQWNHLGDFNQINGDERCLLPTKLWGCDEDYLWYSTGGAACYTDLQAGFLGEGTLQGRYIRGMFGNKPYTLGKYESTRIRAAIAELAANGGAPMGFYTRFLDPLARKEIVRYYNFLERNEAIYRDHSDAEVALLFPRSEVAKGNVAAVESFKKIGRQLLEAHVLFDILPDDLPARDPLKKYRAVIEIHQPSPLAKLPPRRSQFAAAKTIRVSAGQQRESTLRTLHFVNYNRIEPKEKHSPGSGIVDEKPIATTPFEADFDMTHRNITATHVRFASPEHPDWQPLPFRIENGRLKFTVPTFLVYGVVKIE